MATIDTYSSKLQCLQRSRKARRCREWPKQAFCGYDRPRSCVANESSAKSWSKMDCKRQVTYIAIIVNVETNNFIVIFQSTMPPHLILTGCTQKAYIKAIVELEFRGSDHCVPVDSSCVLHESAIKEEDELIKWGKLERSTSAIRKDMVDS